MTIDFTKPVQTRSGLAVRILCTDGHDVAYPVVGFAQDRRRYTRKWTGEGKFFSDGRVDELDLVNVPEEPRSQYDRVIDHFTERHDWLTIQKLGALRRDQDPVPAEALVEGARDMVIRSMNTWLDAQPKMNKRDKLSLSAALASDLRWNPATSPTHGAPGVDFEGE